MSFAEKSIILRYPEEFQKFEINVLESPKRSWSQTCQGFVPLKIIEIIKDIPLAKRKKIFFNKNIDLYIMLNKKNLTWLIIQQIIL